MTSFLPHPVLIALLACCGCASSPTEPARPQLSVSHHMGGPMLVGACTRADLEREPFDAWFRAGYDSYEVAEDDAVALAAALAGCRIEAFFGTWCGDSRRGIPSLVKSLDAAGLAESSLSLHALSDLPRAFKRSPDGLARERLIHRVPTILVYRDGILLGRIVESPRERMELDLARIAAGEPYEARYGVERRVHELVVGRGLDAFARERAILLAEFRANGGHETLPHYAEFDLLSNGLVPEAIAVLELYRELEPDSEDAKRLHTIALGVSR